MINDRRRILELALESLELKKKEIDNEIAEIKSELHGKTVSKKPLPKKQKKSSVKKAVSKKGRFTEEEKLRRSKRMKEYWKNWRKNNEKSKKA